MSNKKKKTILFWHRLVKHFTSDIDALLRAKTPANEETPSKTKEIKQQAYIALRRDKAIDTKKKPFWDKF